jgi:flagellar hook-length control protein FliK
MAMDRAIESIRATIAVAARQGTSQARIQLAPASLGSIRIQLQRTDDGLVARVVADRPETAAALQSSASELRRSLEATGQPLLRLDIEASGEHQLPGEAADPHRTASNGDEQPLTEEAVALGDGDAAGLGAVDMLGALVDVLA